MPARSLPADQLTIVVVAAVGASARLPRDPPYTTRRFQKLRKGPGEELPYIKLHGLRHCAVSLMLASGADIAVVSKLLGTPRFRSPQTYTKHLVGTVASDAVNGAATLITRTVLAQGDVST